MLFLKEKTFNGLCFTLESNTITAAYFTQKKNEKPILCAYQETTLRKPISYRHVILYQNIVSSIVDFVSKHQIAKGYCAFSLIPSSIYEQTVVCANAHPEKKDFIAHLPSIKKMVWHTTYLYPEDHGHRFYLAALYHSALLQYQFITMALPWLVCLGMTTAYTTYLYCYKQLYGAAFRATQLAADIKKQKKLAHFFTPEILNRMVTTKNILPKKQSYSTLAKLIGLFFFAKEHYERN